MDTNRDYEHPILGKITDSDIEVVQNHRHFIQEWDERDKRKIGKIDKIIKALAYSAEYAENSAALKRIVKMLERFKEEEL